MKALRFAVGAVAIAALATTAACWYTGKQFEERVTRTLAAHSGPDLSIQLYDYRRGLFSARAQTRWQLGSSAQALSFQVEHHIKHGPLPAGKLARVTSHFDFAQALPAELLALFGDAPPLALHSTIALNGHHQHRLVSPQVSGELEGQRLHWAGLEGELAFREQNHHAQIRLLLPALELQGEDAQGLTLQGLQFELEARKPEGYAFWTGPASLAIEQLQLHNADAVLLAEGLSLQQQFLLDDDLVSQRSQLTVRQLVADTDRLEALQLEVELARLDARALSALWQASAQPPEQLAMALFANLPKLLSRQPYLQLHHLSALSPTGEGQLAARLDYLGDGQLLAFAPERELRLEASLAASQGLIRQLLTIQQHAELRRLAQLLEWAEDSEDFQVLLQQNVQRQQRLMVERGILLEQGDQWISEARYEHGHFTINGHPADGLLRTLLARLF